MVTGATSGIGRALALCLANHGAQILLHGRSEDRVASIVQGRPNFIPVIGDLATVEGCVAVETGIQAFQPDILVLNAAELGERSLVRDLKDLDITRAVNVNFLSQIRLARAF